MKQWTKNWSNSRAYRTILVVLAVPCVAGMPAESRQVGSQTGSIEFVARVTPTDGRPEPVRQLTFYLLRKSFADIQKEAEETEPKPDLDRFIEGLEVSNELKAWMKRHQSIDLAGAAFLRRLEVNDILNVPEFYQAYLKRNAGDRAADLPTPKYHESDRQRNPQKYEKQRQEYRQLLRKFIENNPQSVDGMDAHLETINPGQRWTQQESEHRRVLRQRALALAETGYLVVKTDSDLEGRGGFAGLLPGEYWLSTLETRAIIGDARQRWDAPVSVRAGRITRVELSNLNSVP